MSGIKPSPELLAVARRWFDAVPNRRADEIGSMMSESDHLTFVGTDENELWKGRAVREGVADFFGAVPDFAGQVETFGEAFECGSTGWAIFTHEVSFAQDPGQVFFVRNTLVFALEHGSWKIIHRHGSLPYANADFTGVEQTAIAELISAARQSFSLDQRQGHASIMFTDIVNSSRLASVLGDRLWSSEVAHHFTTLREIIENHGGQFVKSLGDGTMSSFPTPEQALSAAQTILHDNTNSDGPDIGLRIGIHTGDVVQTEDDFFGTVVNKAARIASIAAANEIHLSDTTHDLLDNAQGFQFLGPAARILKGFEGEHALYRLEWHS